MPPAAGSRTPKLPSKQCLAFAFAIVHSKPDELSMEEYIAHLRQHVAKGRRENALSVIHRHLDRSSYWRSEYERVRDALLAAEAESTDLKLEIDRLKAASGSARPATGVKKRKRQGDEDVVPVPRSPKVSKADGAQKVATFAPANVDAGFSFPHLGEHGDTLMRGFYKAHALLKSREKTNPELLAQHLVSAANAVSEILQDVAQQHCTKETFELDTLKAVLTAVSRAMQSLLVGYGRVSNVAGGEEVRGRIVYAYVQILEKCSIIFSDFAKAEVENPGLDNASRPVRPSTSKGKAKQPLQPATKQKKVAALSLLSGFLITSIDLLDAKTDAHRALFEAQAYVFIEKLAASLYTLVFGRPRSTTLEEEIAASANTDDIDDVSQTSPAPEEKYFKAAKLEAPYLIRILTRLMQAAPAYFGAVSTTKGGKSKATSKVSTTKNNLAITAKERLQSTLINCMFGTEDGEQDPFLDILQKPTFGGSLPPVPVVGEADVQDWFKEEVWRLLGWEVLAKEGAW